MTRDEFLTEKMGYRFVQNIEPDIIIQDKKSGTTRQISPEKWFFILWNWAKEQEWWDEIRSFISYTEEDGTLYSEYSIAENLIHPDRFADAVAKYLGWEK